LRDLSHSSEGTLRESQIELVWEGNVEIKVKLGQTTDLFLEKRFQKTWLE